MGNLCLKILSIILIPVLLLSITGAGIHLHYCNTNNQLYTGIHLVAGDITEPDCCLNKEATISCCIPDKKTCDISLTECCIDIYSGVETDEIYETRVFKHQFLPAEIPVCDFAHQIYFVDKPTLLITGNDISPPDLISSVVLLL